MGLNEKMTTRFEVTTDRTREDIISRIESGRKKGFVTNIFMADAVDYNEFSISDNRIEINRRPIFVDAFRSSGTITIDINSSETKTVLNCQVLPFHGNLSIIVTLGAFGLMLWTLFGFLIWRGVETLLFILITWTIGIAVASIVYLLTKYGLINYSKRVIREITLHNSNSIKQD